MGIHELLGYLASQFQQPPNYQRFSYQAVPEVPGFGRAPAGYQFILTPDGEVNTARLDATPWVDIGYPTQRADLRALTLGAHSGTSEGDAWSDPDIYAARHIVGRDMVVLPKHVEAYK